MTPPACDHVAAVTITPSVMTDILKAWSTGGLNAVQIKTSCTECGTDILVNLVKYNQGEGGGVRFTHVESFPSEDDLRHTIANLALKKETS